MRAGQAVGATRQQQPEKLTEDVEALVLVDEDVEVLVLVDEGVRTLVLVLLVVANVAVDVLVVVEDDGNAHSAAVIV